MNFDIHYVLQYRYEDEVTDNLNSLRVRPAATPTQKVDDFQVRLDPEARITRHLDYFGTEVLEFGVAKLHDHLKIDVRAKVSTSPPALPPASDWDGVTGKDYLEQSTEFLMLGPEDPGEAAIASLVAEVRGETPTKTLQKLCEVIPDRFEYRSGATYVGSTVSDLLSGGAGVCQDFVHLGLLLLRRNGIAARYVSGYLFLASEEGFDSVELQTHAWVEALVPSDDPDGDPIWVGGDPTNRGLVGETHVKIGHGRSYSDVPPTKGVYFGGSGADVQASVKMVRLDAVGAA